MFSSERSYKLKLMNSCSNLQTLYHFDVFYWSHECLSCNVQHFIHFTEHHLKEHFQLPVMYCMFNIQRILSTPWAQSSLFPVSFGTLWGEDDAINCKLLQHCHCAFPSFTPSLPCQTGGSCTVFSRRIWIDAVSTTLTSLRAFVSLLPKLAAMHE